MRGLRAPFLLVDRLISLIASLLGILPRLISSPPPISSHLYDVFSLLQAGCDAMRRCPTIFQARELCTKAKYRDLSGHLFSVPDIVWLCEEMQGGLHEPWSGQVTSLPAVGRRYGLEVAGLRL
jgi:hypothetical protein